MKILTTAAVAVGLSVSATAALAEVSGNVALATDYLFRGISQTSELPAIQGGFDYEHESGFYAGVWGSNVEFGDAKVNMEIDVYAGFGFAVSEAVALDVGILHYQYPGDSGLNYDFNEAYASIGLFGATLGINYSPEYFGDTDAYFYYYGEYSLSVAESVSIDAHIGYNQFDSDEAFGAFLALDAASEDEGYIDYSLGVAAEFQGIGLSLAYVGSDIDDEECGGGSLCEGRVVFGVSKSL